MTTGRRRIRPRTAWRAAAICSVIVFVTACAPSAPDDSGSPDTTPANEAGPSGFPVTVENCGREVTLEQAPQRVVGTEGAAETLFALGASEQTVGYFGSKPTSLPDDLREQAEQTKYLGSSFPFPTAEQVVENDPDLVVLYSFGDAGDLAEQLDSQQIPYLQLSESCDEPDHTVEGYFADVEMIASALGDSARGEELVEGWRTELPQRVDPGNEAPTVVVYGNMDPTQPFVSGAGSFVQDQLDYAGGINAYADSPEGYLTPSWEDIASREPDIIFSGGGGGDETRQDIQDYLDANAALAQMPAVRENRVITLDYAKNVPGPQAITGIKEISAAVDAAS